jgi:hypothetical protein
MKCDLDGLIPALIPTPSRILLSGKGAAAIVCGIL